MNLSDLLALLSDSMRIHMDKLKSSYHSYIFNGLLFCLLKINEIPYYISNSYEANYKLSKNDTFSIKTIFDGISFKIPIDSYKQLFCFFKDDDMPIIILYSNKALHKISKSYFLWTKNVATRCV